MQLQSFTIFNLATLVLALGKWLTSKIPLLREFNIPEPVTSGLLVCLAATALHVFADIQLGFNLATRDFLLLYFFAAIGLNSDFKTLHAGGQPTSCSLKSSKKQPDVDVVHGEKQQDRLLQPPGHTLLAEHQSGPLVRPAGFSSSCPWIPDSSWTSATPS